ncbi:hypothetical protein [Pedobacter sp. SYP-B3415]|uniref:DUF6965 family protein n=1 Tax=Pedobacter sp. SYP-B3415 TaxID=2496641 RepID=UPI00101D4F40|nr:hypothetical protein [Pedobacter sp. SYP-B3415]
MHDIVDYFQTATLPQGPVRLGPHLSISNVPEFVKVHLMSIEAAGDNWKLSGPLIERLEKLRYYIESSN